MPSDATDIIFSPSCLVDLVAAPALYLDRTGSVVAVNQLMDQSMSAAKTPILGTSVYDYIHLDDRRETETFVSSTSDPTGAKASEPPADLSLRFNSNQALLSPCFAQTGAVDGFLLQLDGRALLAENLMWETAVVAGRLGVWDHDFGHDVRYHSPSWWHLRDVNDVKDQVYHHDEWMAKVHPDDCDIFKRDVDFWKDIGREFFEFRYRERKDDGSWRWIITRGRFAHWENDGKPRRVFGMDADITEHVEAEERRAALAEQLNHSERLKSLGQLTGSIAHDFNNLLVTISGNAELLELEIGRSVPELTNILSAVQHGGKLTKAMLAFSRKESLTPSIVDTSDFITKNCTIIKRSLGKAIDIKLNIAPDVGDILTDPTYLENVLINLMVNARDAMKAEGTMTVTAKNIILDDAFAKQHVDVLPGEYVVFSIIDDGEGMTKEVLSQAFNPFFTTKPSGEGTGLGLSSVFGFAKQSRGHVLIASTSGEGTAVDLYLPRVK